MKWGRATHAGDGGGKDEMGKQVAKARGNEAEWIDRERDPEALCA